jgi:hypothetical protein
MSYRLVLCALVTTAVVAAGCSSSKPAAPSSPASSAKSSTAQASASTPADTPSTQASGAKLDADACVAVTQANLDLSTANNHDDAQKAADTFEKYSPPADVQEAVDHFVQTNGAQFDDPDYDKYNKRIDEWVKQVCPLGG